MLTVMNLNQGKRSVFRNLCSAMLAFGMLAGFAFPPFAWFMLHTPLALSPSFLAMCVAAGLMVGLANYLLFKQVVSKELERVTRQMQALGEKVVAGHNFRDPSAVALLEISSADPIGDITQALNTVTQGVVTRCQREFEVMQQSEARFRLLTENMSDLVCLHEATGIFTYVSPSCEALLGYQPSELTQQHPRQLLHPEDRRVFRRGERGATQGSLQTLTYRLRHSSGHYLWVETRLRTLKDDAGQVVHLVSSSRDVTERKRVEAELERSALYDALTELPNRVLFNDRLTQVLEREKRRPDNGFAVLFLDLDRFKTVNDTLGHTIGDALLVAIGARLQECVRPSDTVARLGGDEFTVLLTDIAGIKDAELAAERIRLAFTRPLEVPGYSLQTSVSVGIAMSATGYDRAEEILRDADIAMYHAKAQGRACYQTFTVELRERILSQLALEEDLREALRQGALEVYYQPIVAVESSQPEGFEALVRWQHPVHGTVSPADFIPLAEETGLIVELDAFVLQAACQQVRQWQLRRAQPQPLFLSVNLSSQSFAQPELPQHLAHVLATSGFPAAELRLELTERVFVQQTAEVAKNLADIRALGVQLYIDDFGTGYSSLSYLQHLPVSTLKIDRSFIEPLMKSLESVELVRTILAMARGLGLKVVAEGIETPEQLARLSDLGCDYGQGYLFSRPLPAAEIEAFMGISVPPAVPNQTPIFGLSKN